MLNCVWCGFKRNLCTCRHKPQAIRGTRDFVGPFHRVKVRRAIGVEVELSEWGKLKNSELFTYTCSSLHPRVEHDSSVYPSGEELIVGPFSGDNIISNMEKLCVLLRTSKCFANDTCSVHVHVDARDDSMWCLRSLILLYLQWQLDFMKMFPRSRVTWRPDMSNNGYAKPIMGTMLNKLMELKDSKTSKGIKEILYNALYKVNLKTDSSFTIASVKNNKYDDCRYTGMNLHSWMMRGTIEYRHHEGSLDPHALITYPLFCAAYTELTSTPNAYNKYKSVPFVDFIKSTMPKFIQDWVDMRYTKFRSEWDGQGL